MPGFEDSYEDFPFHPLFIESVKIYNTIRFMGWQNTNAVSYGDWKLRSRKGFTRSYSSSAEVNGVANGGFGVSIDDMILLANTVGANAWFNIPHLATDEYVENFAIMVRDMLRPDVDIYLELSNEVWGTLFPGGNYAQTQGLKMGISKQAATARFCYYILRSNQIFTIWKTVFDTNGTSKRLKFILASQAVNPDVTRQMLACSTFNKSTSLVTSIAIAPYFGTYNQYQDRNIDVFMNTTLRQQINELSSSVSGHYSLARSASLSLITYESGQGLQGSGSLTGNLALLANRFKTQTILI